MRYRLTRLADGDIESVLRFSFDRFDPRRMAAYADLIDAAIALAVDEPGRASSRARPEFGVGVRSLYLDVAAGRRGAASHQIYFVEQAGADGGPSIVVLRVLHDGMEPAHRLVAAVQETVTRS